MTYAISWAASAARSFAKLPAKVQVRIGAAVTGLATNPRPHGVKSMSGDDAGRMRIRVGDYRVIYELRDDALYVLVLRIGHRREVYR